ncbi:MAG: hypothetical protein JWO48_298 [Bryobacterales bacterium]|nr:hypothetical protein [Bryobacterales bacterium]
MAGVFRVSRIRLLLTIIVSAPAAFISVWSITRTLSQMFDPCVRWESSGGISGTLSDSIGPNDVCKSLTVHGESKFRVGTVGALVPGVVLVSTLLATIGVAVSRRWLIFVGAILMLAETSVVLSIAPLTLITGLLYLLVAKWVPRTVQPHQP